MENLIIITIKADDLLRDCGDYCRCQAGTIATGYTAAIRRRLEATSICSPRGGDRATRVVCRWYYDDNLHEPGCEEAS